MFSLGLAWELILISIEAHKHASNIQLHWLSVCLEGMYMWLIKPNRKKKSYLFVTVYMAECRSVRNAFFREMNCATWMRLQGDCALFCTEKYTRLTSMIYSRDFQLNRLSATKCQMEHNLLLISFFLMLWSAKGCAQATS